jgi:hypothetical protein
VSDVYKKYSHNCKAGKIIPPTKQRSNNELMKQTMEPNVSPLLQVYEKRVDGGRCLQRYQSKRKVYTTYDFHCEGRETFTVENLLWAVR